MPAGRSSPVLRGAVRSRFQRGEAGFGGTAAAEMAAIQQSILRGSPYGSDR